MNQHHTLNKAIRAVRVAPVVFVLLMTSLLPLPSGYAYAAKAKSEQIVINGVKRDYLVQTPSKNIAGPYPLVIVLHGGGGRAAHVARNPQFSKLPEQRGAVVLYPDAIQHAWNVAGIPQSKGSIPTQDDVSFISQLIDTAIAKYNADPARVLITGASRGGLMTFYLCQKIPKKNHCRRPYHCQLAGYSCTGYQESSWHPHHDSQWHGRSFNPLQWRKGRFNAGKNPEQT